MLFTEGGLISPDGKQKECEENVRKIPHEAWKGFGCITLKKEMLLTWYMQPENTCVSDIKRIQMQCNIDLFLDEFQC